MKIYWIGKMLASKNRWGFPYCSNINESSRQKKDKEVNK